MTQEKTSKPKSLTPYQRLLTSAKTTVFRLRYPRKQIMWVYPADRLASRWDLAALRERVAAADQLDYDVRLKADQDGGLKVEYVKRVGEYDIPWSLR